MNDIEDDFYAIQFDPFGNEITYFEWLRTYQLISSELDQAQRDSSLLKRSANFSRIMREETACLL